MSQTWENARLAPVLMEKVKQFYKSGEALCSLETKSQYGFLVHIDKGKTETETDDRKRHSTHMFKLLSYNGGGGGALSGQRR